MSDGALYGRRSQRIAAVSVLLASLAITAGCGGFGGSATVAADSAVRVVNGMTEEVTVDVWVAGGAVIEGLERSRITSDAQIPPATQPVEVRRSGTTVPLHASTHTFTSDGRHTLILYGRTGTVGTMLLSDPSGLAGDGSTRVRFAHADPLESRLDLYLLRDGEWIGDARPVVANVGAGEAPPAVTLPAGQYRMKIATTGTTSVLLAHVLDLPSAGGRTIVAIDSPSPTLPIFTLMIPDRNEVPAVP